MKVIIIISVLAILLTSLDSRKLLPYGMSIAFLILGFVAAIHYDFGPDYITYLDIFDEITTFKFNLSDILSQKVYKDPGWVILCYIFKPMGFFSLVAFISIFENAVYYSLIRKYVPKERWALAVTIYVFNFSFYLLNMSMLRQGLAVAIFVFAYFYIDEKKYILSAILIFIAYNIHSSALICFPLVFMGLYQGKTAIVWRVLLLTLFAACLLLKEIVPRVYQMLISLEEFERYEFYEDMNKVKSDTIRFGFFIGLIPYFLGLLFLSHYDIDTKDKRIILCYCMGLIFVPFCLDLFLVDRLSFYFNAIGIAAIPIIYNNIKETFLRNILVVVFLFLMFIGYWGTSHSVSFLRSFETFHTIFDVI